MRKQIAAFLTAAALLLLLAACGRLDSMQENTESGAPESSAASEMSEQTEPPVPDDTEQLKLLAQNAALWVRSGETASGSYMVTDLDQNGRLELISTCCEGSGFFSTNEVWEVNAAMDGIVRCDASALPEDNQPDLISFSETAAYFSDGVYQFVFNDFTRESAAETGETRMALALADGKLQMRILGSMKQTYDVDSDEIITAYYDADGVEIDEETYLALGTSVFAGAQEYRAAFGWINFDAQEASAMTQEQWLTALQTSWACFSLERQ